MTLDLASNVGHLETRTEEQGWIDGVVLVR